MITERDVPVDALLQRYVERNDCFTDCYFAPTTRPITLPTLLSAFYGTWVFAPEKFLLRVALGTPARDFDVWPLAMGEADRFAAWTVEARREDQVLLQDVSGRTRSWLSVTDEGVYFGSAVVPPNDGGELGRIFRALLGFHRLYSKMLLGAAVRRLAL